MTGRQLSYYLVEDRIGEGGMGVVYKGTDTRLRRTVALKFLNKSLPAETAERKRFLREARAASSINHPNVCVIHAIEEVEGEEFIVMEYVEGLTLRKWMGKKRQGSAPAQVPLRDTLAVAHQVADGLEAAHKKGIVHRDIKPENVMVTPEGRAKIMDFGLAKLEGESRMTRTGATMGTVAYMSPEQVQGGDIDQQSDIYSFGVLLYEMLTGTVPFHADHALGMMYAIVSTKPKPLRELRRGIDPGLEAVVMKCMAKDKRARYATMREVITGLMGWEDQSTVTALPPLAAVRERGIHSLWRSYSTKAKLLASGVALLALAAGFYLGIVRTSESAGARLTITSDPPGGEIWLNGSKIGKSPLEASRTSTGPVAVRVVLDSYGTVDTLIEMSDGQHAVLHFPLQSIAGRDDSSRLLAQKGSFDKDAGSKRSGDQDSRLVAPSTIVTVDDLAASLLVQLHKGAGQTRGGILIQPFSFRDTQFGSTFSRYLKSVVESRIQDLAGWSVLSVNEQTGGASRQANSNASLEITGTYWEQPEQMRFFAQLHNVRTGEIASRAEAAMSLAELRKLGYSWKPRNLRRLLTDRIQLGQQEPDSGDLSLELFTNKGKKDLIFVEGDTLKTFIRVNKPCTVRVFYYAIDGTRYALTGPGDRRIDASQVNTIIAIDSAECTLPEGAEILQAFATTDRFGPIRTKAVADGYYVLQDGIEDVMRATRVIKKLGRGTDLAEKRLSLTILAR